MIAIQRPDGQATEHMFTLDDLIERALELRAVHGGLIPVACYRDSARVTSLFRDLGTYEDAEQAWEPEDRHRGPVITLTVSE